MLIHCGEVAVYPDRAWPPRIRERLIQIWHIQGWLIQCGQVAAYPKRACPLRMRARLIQDWLIYGWLIRRGQVAAYPNVAYPGRHLIHLSRAAYPKLAYPEGYLIHLRQAAAYPRLAYPEGYLIQLRQTCTCPGVAPRGGSERWLWEVAVAGNLDAYPQVAYPKLVLFYGMKYQLTLTDKETAYPNVAYPGWYLIQAGPHPWAPTCTCLAATVSEMVDVAGTMIPPCCRSWCMSMLGASPVRPYRMG